jgi:hypothetical protein
MKIETGKYYRTRGGQVFGPMVRNQEHDTNFAWCLVFSEPENSWTEGGRWSMNGRLCLFDLVAEVYVSDTSPAPPVNTTKTARDELVEKAALAILKLEILNGRYANPSPMSSYKFAEIWLAAEHFVEARKK